VAYTATPFANLLVDPGNYEDIYPRDFIVELPRPEDYFGPEKVFGREPLTSEEDDSVTDGLDVIRHVGLDEISALQPPRRRADLDDWQPEVTPSLQEALNWFVLATAARRRRATGVRHSTMLIHTSMLAAAHNRLRVPVEAYLRRLEAGWSAGDLGAIARLRNQWDAEVRRVPPATVPIPLSWDDVAGHVSAVLGDLRVIVDNYLSSERLSYDKNGSDVVAVVIGGNTLSRGLTLEGLVCSFFVRAASAYDTLLQMGRWFGYRTGYGDLTRMWMTEDLESWFFALATVEEEVRREIRRYEQEQLRPSDVPVRIRCHPAMAVTSAAKMRAAVPARISFSQAREQTILFNHRESEWLRHNLSAVRRLIASLLDNGLTAKRTTEGRPIFHEVMSEQVRSFIADYRFHERAYRMRTDLLIGYLDEQNQQGYLRQWNVVVMAHPTTANGTVDIGLGEPVGLIERSRLDMPSIPHANIKSLVSTVDRVADLDVPRSQLRNLIGSQPDDKRLAAYREDILGDVGLLCLYPISKDSRPRPSNGPTQLRPGTRPRVRLDATDHVIGVGLFFPEARGGVKEYTYLAADLSRVDRESDDVDIVAIDAADELAAEAEIGTAHASGTGTPDSSRG
jgi:Z1 domain